MTQYATHSFADELTGWITEGLAQSLDHPTLNMTEKAQRRIHIKWVRSGIGFDRSQSEVVRSLGLRRLNQIVERPDTPQVRGLVAKVAHLVEVVNDVPKPLWVSTPGYVVKAAASEPEGGTGVPPPLGYDQPVLSEAKDGATDGGAAAGGEASASALSPQSEAESSGSRNLQSEIQSKESPSSQSKEGIHDREQSEKT